MRHVFAPGLTGEPEARAREAEMLGQLQTEQSLLAQFQSEMTALAAALDRGIQQIEGQRKP